VISSQPDEAINAKQKILFHHFIGDIKMYKFVLWPWLRTDSPGARLLNRSQLLAGPMLVFIQIEKITYHVL